MICRAFIFIYLLTLSTNVCASGQNFDYRNGSALSQLSPEDRAAAEKFIRDGNAIQNYAAEQYKNPNSPVSQEFLNLHPGLQSGAKDAVIYMREQTGQIPRK